MLRISSLKVLTLALVVYSLSSSAADKYDGAVFGADGFATDCASLQYQEQRFQDLGSLFCLLAKEQNIAFSALYSTAAVASTLEVKERCNFEYTKIGLDGISQTKLNFPKTWRIYMSIVQNSHGGISCEMAKRSSPLLFKIGADSRKTEVNTAFSNIFENTISTIEGITDVDSAIPTRLTFNETVRKINRLEVRWSKLSEAEQGQLSRMIATNMEDIRVALEKTHHIPGVFDVIVNDTEQLMEKLTSFTLQ